ncbi:MAG: SdrD B-like domain-containing protein, partial [Chitinophagaceae bacterium]
MKLNQQKTSRWQKILSIVLLFMLTATVLQAQITGAVFRDFNGNGVKDTNEPLVSGVTVRAYNTAGTLCGTTTTSGTTSPNYSLTGCSTGQVRVEFSIPANGNCVNSGIDFSSFAGSDNASSVQFVNGNSTGVDFALHNPNDYN